MSDVGRARLDRRGVIWGAVCGRDARRAHVARQRSAGLVRRRARRLPVRRRLRGLRRRLPVRGLAAAAADGACSTGAGGRRSAQRTGPQRSPRCPASSATQLLAQTFIRRRSRARWLAHQLVFWGCILAGARHVPAHVRPAALRERRPAGRPLPGVRRRGSAPCSFDAESVVGWLIFHALDIAAVLVLAGVFIFLRRRLRDPGALAVERCGDFLALAGLFAVSVTGLFLTVSSTLAGRAASTPRSTRIHALTVILGLMYIPFGKLFHIFQRPGNLGVALLQAGERRRARGGVPRCGEAFASAAADRRPRRTCSRRSGSTTRIDGGGSYQDTCPRVPAPAGHARAVGARRRVRLMARPPITEEELIARYGPHLNEAPPGGWDAGRRGRPRSSRRTAASAASSAASSSRCTDNEVVGFEPWYEFPFNEGKLCPKGVKRYLQGSHPDRLLAPAGARPVVARRVPRRSAGTRRSTASSAEIRRIQAELRRRRVRDAVGRLAHEREDLPDRQVRPRRARTPPTSTTTAGSAWCRPAPANKKAFGIDRAPNPWSDIPLADVVWVAGLERRRVVRRSPRATSGRRATAAPSSSSQDPRVTPARPHRRPLPAGAARAPTRRCSARCCTC